ncbi:MAG: selenoneine synthase SenA [Marinobacter sp.]|uniref:selenoneine synthase SenA n=1 Tax=Marinobacter sp. TaxID=50741 RepID=UPI00299D469C|nr:selenoneine synthase SenA [Marinobacter sp.]MDX1635802.1 selenoneine synthase SenA [Marinobacter sp.]
MEDRDSLLQALHQTRARTLALIDSLPDDKLMVPYHPGVNPPLWEMGHAAFFYEVFILAELDGKPSYDPAMDDLWDSFHIDHRDRWQPGLFPGREATRHYFNVVYDRIEERIRTEPLSDRALYLYRYAIYHQNMHIESMIWCRQTVGYEPPPGTRLSLPAAAEGNPEPENLGDAEIPAGTYLIGMPGDSPDFARHDFAFDNEKPRFEKHLDSFRISRTLVSNAEFLAFVEDGGYERRDLWSFGGRKWLDTEVDLALVEGHDEPVMRRPRHPLYWRRRDGQWQERVFDQWQPLPRAHPVTHVSYWEAEAYCNWAGRRLPTEFEWEAAALGNRPGAAFRRFPWGDEPHPERVDMDGHYLAQQPVAAMPEGDGPFGCRQMLGTVWEWTTTQFLPYDGFCVDIYPYMSTLQFGDHKVTKGGSCATSSLLIRGTYRQAYLPQRNDVYTGFRTCAL